MLQEIIGNKYGKLTVLSSSDKRSSGGAILYKCQCDCGNISYVPRRHLLSGHTKSCGCVRTQKFKELYENNRSQLVGEKFDRLTVIEYKGADKFRNSQWLCKCDCGNELIVATNQLRQRITRSCGCISKEILKEAHSNNCIDNTNVAVIRAILKDGTSKITKSGVKGICWDKKSRKWRVYITFQGKTYHLGYYIDLEEAVKVRKNAEEKYFGKYMGK